MNVTYIVKPHIFEHIRNQFQDLMAGRRPRALALLSILLGLWLGLS